MGMGALRIIAAVIMAIFAANIIRRLIKGEFQVAAWRKGTMTNDDGGRHRLSSSRSLRFSFGFLLVSMAVFFLSD
jgi:uncharacterized membrane protein YraQ (UPF0718 family)